MFNLDAYRAIKELIQALRDGNEQKVKEWKDRYSGQQIKKDTFGF